MTLKMQTYLGILHKIHWYSWQAYLLSATDSYSSDSQNFQVYASMVAYRKCLHSKPLTVAPLLKISLYTREQISLWNVQLISTRWNFLENCVGDVDVSVFICDSHNDCQWRAGLMLSAGQKSPQKPPGFQLTSTLEIWWTNLCFSYCTSHFSYQNSGSEDLLQFLYVQWNIVVCEMCVCFVALLEYEAESLIPCYSFRNQPSRWNNCTHTISTSKIRHYLKFTKKGKWKHDA